MRILMVSKALVVGAYQHKLAELARQPDIELTAIVPSAWRDGRQVLRLEHTRPAGCELIVAPLVFNGSFHLHFYPTLGSLLRRVCPDLLHMDEEPYNLATWHALRTAEALGIPGLFFTWQNLRRSYPWPFRRFEQANYRRAAYAIAGNRAAAEVLTAKGYTGRLAVIPQFGVDPNLFAPDADGVASGKDSGEFRVGYVGRLVPEKGVDVLLRACAILAQPGWSLHLAGDGPERERLADLAAGLGIAGRVRFAGRLSSSAVASFYRSLHVLVLPSISRSNWIEQFGRVLIEAMASGVAVVGSNSGEIPNVIGDAGLVCPEGDAIALSRALAALAEDPERRRDLAARGRERVLAHFTQARIAAATAEVYRATIRS